MKAYLGLGFLFAVLGMNASAQTSITHFEGNPEYLSTTIVKEKTSNGKEIEVARIERCSPLSLEKGKASCKVIAKQPVGLMRKGLQCLAKKYEKELAGARKDMSQDAIGRNSGPLTANRASQGIWAFNGVLFSGYLAEVLLGSSVGSLITAVPAGLIVIETVGCAIKVSKAVDQKMKGVETQVCAKQLTSPGDMTVDRRAYTLNKMQPALKDALDQIRNLAVEASKNPRGGIQQSCFNYDEGREYLTYATTNGESEPRQTRDIALEGVYMTTIKRAQTSSAGKGAKRVAPPAVVVPTRVAPAH